MMHRSFLFSFLIMTLTAFTSAQEKQVCSFKWKVAAVLPGSNAQSVSLGFAGAINGVNKNVLIVAGGANFPNGMPWEGGKKYYSNEIHVLQKDGEKFCWNKNINDTLPEPIAYCGITSTDAGIFFAGGENENGISDRAFLLNWNADKNKIEMKDLPRLPLALTNISATHIENVVYVVGGDQEKSSSDKFFKIELDNKNPQWESLPDLPIALANATAIVQNGIVGSNIYVIGGRTRTVTGISDLHNTVYAFNPAKQQWKKCADISDGKNTGNLSAAAGIAIGANKILMIGSDNGKIFHQIESCNSRIAKATNVADRDRLIGERNDLMIQHKGFDRSLLLYNTISDEWKKVGDYPYPAQVTTNAVKWGDDVIVSNGEIKPGVRTPNVIIGHEGGAQNDQE